jgi:hypothetical protein
VTPFVAIRPTWGGSVDQWDHQTWDDGSSGIGRVPWIGESDTRLLVNSRNRRKKEIGSEEYSRRVVFSKYEFDKVVW